MAHSSNSNPIAGISCDVRNCHYHKEGGQCVAKEIRVGPGYAISSSDTVCSTFKPDSAGGSGMTM